jgi:hypothetical protein
MDSVSNNVPTLVQEQRDLIQSLLEDKHIDNQKPRQSDVAAESSRASNKTIHGKLAHARAYELSDEKHDSKDHPSTLKNQPSQGSTECANSSEARIEANTASEGNEPTELKEYNILIQSMLNEIESCKSKLENNRQSRIKNGVLNIHYGEIMRFQIEYGRSIPIDHSFATYVRVIFLLLSNFTDIDSEKKPENTIEPKVKSPSLPLTGSHKSTQSTTMSVDCYIGSDESDVSETDMFIPSIKGRTSLCRRLERKETKSNSNSIKPHQVQQRMHEESDGEAVRYSRRRATGRVYREAIPRHHDYESAINQRVLERSGFRYDIENWNHQQEIEVGEHEQDIERLERKNAKTYWKNPPLHEGTPDEPQRVQQKVYDESDKEGVRLSRRRATSRVSREAFPHHRDHEFGMNQRMLERNDICQDMELSRHLEDIERLERELAKFRRKSSPPREVAPAAPQPVPHEFSLICDDEECHDASEQFQAYAAKELEVTGGEQGDSASTAGNSNDEERESENGPQERQSTLSISPQESMMLGMRGDDAQKPTFSEGLSLPDNLEDLLAQWTTLDKQELQCGHVSAF